MTGRRRSSEGNQTTELQRVIRERRLSLRISQAEIAAAIGVSSPEFISMVESGTRKIDLNRIPDLARALKFDPKGLCQLALREEAPVLYAEVFPGKVATQLREVSTNAQHAVLVSHDSAAFLRRIESLPPDVKSHVQAIVRFLYEAYLSGTRLPGPVRTDLSRGLP